MTNFLLKKNIEINLFLLEINWSSCIPKQDIILCCHFCSIPPPFKLGNRILIVYGNIFF